MKLAQCTNCGDVYSLNLNVKGCTCGCSAGWYHECGLHATTVGLAIPIGFTNQTFRHAKNQRPQFGLGSTFDAFVIPVECPTVEHISIPIEVCVSCGLRWGQQHEPKGIGMWSGTCLCCGESTMVADPSHDFQFSQANLEQFIRERVEQVISERRPDATPV